MGLSDDVQRNALHVGCTANALCNNRDSMNWVFDTRKPMDFFVPTIDNNDMFITLF